MELSKYGPEDAGCYADGAFGWTHVREVLAAMVFDLGTSEGNAIGACLLMEQSDDASEEYAAIDLLNEHCEDGVFFTFDDGSLLLLLDDSEE